MKKSLIFLSIVAAGLSTSLAMEIMRTDGPAIRVRGVTPDATSTYPRPAEEMMRMMKPKTGSSTMPMMGENGKRGEGRSEGEDRGMKMGDCRPDMPMHQMVASDTMPNLKQGDGNKNGKGDMVRMLQDMLIKLGYLSASTSTGNYGTMTRDAVVKYQKDMGITNPTGNFGPQTREKMKKKCPMMPGNRGMGTGTPEMRPMASGTMPNPKPMGGCLQYTQDGRMTNVCTQER